MGHAEIDQTLAQAGDTHTTPAMMQVIIDAHGKPGDKTAPTGTLISTNIENRGSSDDQSLNQFPNGVKFGTAAGVLSIEAPPGGKVIDKGGVAFGKSVGLVGPGMGEETLVYDAHKHLVAQFDKNKVMHVHTKNGDRHKRSKYIASQRNCHPCQI
jgi:hypothetical protein